MQILSISGENIASLAAPFAIRLDEGPLSSAGLFAITGETGAGKSSILDAMCLALYGNCPRLSGDGTRESVEDVEGSAFKATDPRMVLRRGATQATAQVVFRAVDGETYAAEWIARRARGRLDGRLQNVDRSLSRLSDGQVVASQPTHVKNEVERLTGLTFAEFRRTVLLAQGDFAAFLDAGTGERAAILEKVTGTEVYRMISQKAYERHAETRRALEDLQTRRAEHRSLDPEEREALSVEIHEFRAIQKAAEAELKHIDADLDTYRAVEEAQAAQNRAAERASKAVEAATSLAADRIWLLDWDKARGLRGEVNERASARKAFEETIATRDDLVRKRDDQQRVLSEAVSDAQTAKILHDEAEATFKRLGPEWSRATALDEKIVTAGEEVRRAERLLAQAMEETKKTRGTRETLEARAATLEAALRNEQERLAQVPDHDALLANWPVLEDRLQARMTYAANKIGWESEHALLTSGIAMDLAAKDKATTKIAAARALISAARGAQDGIAEERAALMATTPVEQLARLTQAAADLRTFEEANRDMYLAEEAIRSSDARRHEAVSTETSAKAAKKEAAAKAAQADVAIAALERPVETADAAVSHEASQLRRYLEHGMPCPVCQSTSHPVMEGSALAELARDLRTQLDAARRDRQDGIDAAQKADRTLAEAHGTLQTEDKARPGLREARDRAARRVTEARQTLDGSPFDADLPREPGVPQEIFDEIHIQITDWRRTLEADRDRLYELDRKFGEAATEIEVQAREAMRLEDDVRDIVARVTGSEARIARLSGDIEAAWLAMSDIDARVTPMLAPVGQAASLFGAGAQERLDQLRHVVGQLARARSEITAHREALADLAADIGRARADSEGKEKAEATCLSQCGERAAIRDALVQERATLLDGEPTETHRTRHNDARRKAFEGLRTAEEKRSAAATRVAGSESALSAATDALAKCEMRMTLSEDALRSVCEKAGLSIDRCVVLQTASEAEASTRRMRLELADREKSEAEGALRERSEALTTLLEKGLPEVLRGDLEVRRDELISASETRGEALGRLVERQAADAEARERLKDLEAEIRGMQAVAETWLAINDAIGSANGDRFAQIAQAVTLGLLVERANQHLRDLKPRYQLEVASSDLALHVIDLDMGGDRRPTRLLSGGERFLVSLALALALSGMGTHGALAGTLFIDEGFGSLDSESLDLAIDALERLQAQGRTVGVISHVQAMKDRIPIQIEVVKTGGGASEVRLRVA